MASQEQTRGGDAYAQNEKFLQDVFAEAASLGDVPVIVCGDYNILVEMSQVLSGLVTSGQWVDAGAAFAAAGDTAPEPTYVFKDQSSRIDMILMNPAATRHFTGFAVLEVPEGGIKRHKPVTTTFDFTIPKSTAWATQTIKRAPTGGHPMTEEELLGLEVTPWNTLGLRSLMLARDLMSMKLGSCGAKQLNNSCLSVQL